MRFRLYLPVALAVGAVSAAPVLRWGQAAAQSPQMSPAAAYPEWRTFVGANPLGIPFDVVAVELETTVAPAATMGVVGSYNDIDDRRYTTIDGRFKYYPAEVAMRGFAVGVSLGWTRFRTPDTFVNGIPVTPQAAASLGAGTLGALVDYNWTQGPSQRFVIGVGLGAKRILASQDERESLNLDRAYVTGRFVIGLLF